MKRVYESGMATAKYLRDERAAALARMRDEREAVHADLVAILAALGIGDHARPYSSHEVVQREVLPAIERLQSVSHRLPIVRAQRDAALARLAAAEALCAEMENPNTEHGTMPGVRMKVRRDWAARLRAALPSDLPDRVRVDVAQQERREFTERYDEAYRRALSSTDPDRIRGLIERSSLGTPEAKAARASVSDEQVQRIAARADELEREADLDRARAEAWDEGRIAGEAP